MESHTEHLIGGISIKEFRSRCGKLAYKCSAHWSFSLIDFGMASAWPLVKSKAFEKLGIVDTLAELEVANAVTIHNQSIVHLLRYLSTEINISDET